MAQHPQLAGDGASPPDVRGLRAGVRGCGPCGKGRAYKCVHRKFLPFVGRPAETMPLIFCMECNIEAYAPWQHLLMTQPPPVSASTAAAASGIPFRVAPAGAPRRAQAPQPQPVGQVGGSAGPRSPLSACVEQQGCLARRAAKCERCDGTAALMLHLDCSRSNSPCFPTPGSPYTQRRPVAPAPLAGGPYLGRLFRAATGAARGPGAAGAHAGVHKAAGGLDQALLPGGQGATHAALQPALLCSLQGWAGRERGFLGQTAVPHAVPGPAGGGRWCRGLTTACSRPSLRTPGPTTCRSQAPAIPAQAILSHAHLCWLPGDSTCD